ncbi:MAG TPA: hypothetical protein VI258_04770, partial [Rhodanobacteraceae bacterium]
MTTAFRVLAIAIAIAGALDPAWTAPRRTRPSVAIVVNDSPTLALPDGNGVTRRATANTIRDRLRADLRRDFSIESSVTSDTVAAVVIGDEYASVARNIPVATVSIADGIAPNVALVRVNAPPEVLPATTIPIAVDIDAAGMRGQTTTLRVMSGGVPLATATHTWMSDRDRWRAALDVPPAGEPPFAFRVEAAPLPGERTAIDNTVDVSVDRRRERLRVLAYDGRPSWAATFLRRALESDPRFDVETLTATSPNVAARTGGAIRLGDASLSTFDAVIVGGLEALTTADLRALDEFMRQRGGGVLVVPDRRIDDRAILEWLQLGPLREQLFEQPDSLTVPQGLPAVRASELLLVGSLPPLGRALARASGENDAAAIVMTP